MKNKFKKLLILVSSFIFGVSSLICFSLKETYQSTSAATGDSIFRIYIKLANTFTAEIDHLNLSDKKGVKVFGTPTGDTYDASLGNYVLDIEATDTSNYSIGAFMKNMGEGISVYSGSRVPGGYVVITFFTYDSSGWGNINAGITGSGYLSTVSYKKGQYGSGTELTKIYEKNRIVTSSDALFTRQHYTQTSWNTKEDGTGTTYNLKKALLASDISLFPVWKADEHTVLLDAQGGKDGTSSVTVSYDSPMPTITIPTKGDRPFNGYFTSPCGEGTKYYNADGTSARNSDITEDITLYASWTSFFSGGSGTYRDPYLISSLSDLETLAVDVSDGITYENKYFKLTNDIGSESRDKFTKTIGSRDSGNTFNGNFDGGNYNIYIDLNNILSHTSIGLFESLSNATLKNINLYGDINFEISTQNEEASFIGGFCAFASSSVIDNCNNYANITASSSVQTGYLYLGGFAGYASQTKFYNCVNHGNISGSYNLSSKSHIGGICGCSQHGSAFNTGNIGKLTGSKQSEGSGLYIGGIAGQGYQNDGTKEMHIANCYNVGSINKTIGGASSTSRIGAIYGYSNDSSTIYLDNVFRTSADLPFIGNNPTNVVTTNLITISDAQARSAEGSRDSLVDQLNVYATTHDCFSFLSWCNDGTYYPTHNGIVTKEGTASDPYLISSLSDLENLANNVTSGTKFKDKYFKVTNDIGSKETPFTKMIGNDVNAFYGHFDGDKYSIWINLEFSDNTPHIGLFSTTQTGSELTNVVVRGNINVTNLTDNVKRIGGVAGRVLYGTINGCYNYADISFTGLGQNSLIDIGGVVGSISDTNSCFNLGNFGTVTANFTDAPDKDSTNCVQVGGVVGRLNQGSLYNSFNQGDVSLYTPNWDDRSFVGGVVGDMMTNTDRNIANCYSVGRVYRETSDSVSQRQYNGKIIGAAPNNSNSFITMTNCWYLVDSVYPGLGAFGDRNHVMLKDGNEGFDYSAHENIPPLFSLSEEQTKGLYTDDSLIKLLNDYADGKTDYKQWMIIEGKYPTHVGAITSKVILDHQVTTGKTETIRATYDFVLPSIDIPSKGGYTFKGYFTEIGGKGDQYINSDGSPTDLKWCFEEDKTLYASWELDPSEYGNWNISYNWHNNDQGDFVCDANLIHKVDTDSYETINSINISNEITTKATFTEKGIKTWTATFNDPRLPESVQTTTEYGPVIKDDFIYEYAWSGDDTTGYSCHGKATYIDDPRIVYEEDASITSFVSREPTCDLEGIRVYVASFDTFVFEAQYLDKPIEKTEHIWGTPTYTWIKSDTTDYEVKAEVVCVNFSTHTKSETVNVSSTITVLPTLTTPGEIVYTATFTDPSFETQTRTEVIPPLDITDFDILYSWYYENNEKYCFATAISKNYQDLHYDETAKGYVVVDVPSECEIDGQGHYEADFDFIFFSHQVDDEVVAVPPHGHVYYDYWIYDRMPTLTEGGIRSHHCIYCDHITDIEITDKLNATNAQESVKSIIHPESEIEEEIIDNALADMPKETLMELSSLVNVSQNKLDEDLIAGLITKEEYEEKVEIIQAVSHSTLILGSEEQESIDDGILFNEVLPTNTSLDYENIFEDFYERQMDILLNRKNNDPVKSLFSENDDEVDTVNYNIDAETYNSAIEFVDYSLDHMLDAGSRIRECSCESLTVTMEVYVTQIQYSVFTDFNKEEADKEFVENAYAAIMLEMQNETKSQLEDQLKQVSSQLEKDPAKENLIKEQIKAVEDNEQFEIMVMEVLRQNYNAITGKEITLEEFEPIYREMFRRWALNEEQDVDITLEELTNAVVYKKTVEDTAITVNTNPGGPEIIIFSCLGGGLLLAILAGVLTSVFISKKKKKEDK